MTARKPKPPTLPIRPHTYVPDVSQAPDWRGERPCSGCSMPKKSRVHDYKISDLESERRRIGEGRED